MNTENTRITRPEAAKLAKVSPRQINRWSAAGLISVERDPSFRKPATYDPEEVLRAARMRTVELPEESGISTA
ncbi:MAG TPA: MerR family transcriptional regulator [Pyrinomonadaceae bacterium]|nr:MerR family transcriptional regulator [Pyrinomonadaceae bacterium]